MLLEHISDEQAAVLLHRVLDLCGKKKKKEGGGCSGTQVFWLELNLRRDIEREGEREREHVDVSMCERRFGQREESKSNEKGELM